MEHLSYNLTHNCHFVRLTKILTVFSYVSTRNATREWLETMLPLSNTMLWVKRLTGLTSYAWQVLQALRSGYNARTPVQQFLSFILLARFEPNTPLLNSTTKFYTRPTLSKRRASIFPSNILFNAEQITQG